MRKEQIPEPLLRTAKDVAKELFNLTIVSQEADFILKDFNEALDNKVLELNENLKQYATEKRYPGKTTIEDGIVLLSSLQGNRSTKKAFEDINQKRNELLDFAEDFEYINSFFKNQQDIWDKSLRLMDLYEDSKTFVLDENVQKLYQSIISILDNTKPYSKIKDLPSLNESFSRAYGDLLEKEYQPIKSDIQREKEVSLRHLNSKKQAIHKFQETSLDQNDQFSEEMEKLHDTISKYEVSMQSGFVELNNKAESENNIRNLRSYKDEAEVLRKNWSSKIDKIELPKSGSHPLEPQTDNIKVTTSISLQSLTSVEWTIENDEDIDKYLNDLKKQLQARLKDNTIIKVEI